MKTWISYVVNMTIKINHLKFYPNVASLSYDPRSTVKAVHKMFQIVKKEVQNYWESCFLYLLQEVANYPTKEPFFTVPWLLSF